MRTHASQSLPERPEEAPFLGVGLGLRPAHQQELLHAAESGKAPVDWLELLSENYMVPGGRPLRILEAAAAAYPVTLHGVSMSIGSTDPLDDAYLDDLAALADRSRARWITDHLCWTGIGGHNLHDLLPLPYSDVVAQHVASRVDRVQQRLGRRIALENVSSYLGFTEDAMPEWTFLAEVAERADCGILLDVNNVFVSAHNHGFSAEDYIDAIPAERVFQIHLAGHSVSPPLLIDTHDHLVCDEVWALFAYTIRRMGPISTSIEWDGEPPPLAVLLEEVERARKVLEQTLAQSGAQTNIETRP